MYFKDNLNVTSFKAMNWITFAFVFAFVLFFT